MRSRYRAEGNVVVEVDARGRSLGVIYDQLEDDPNPRQLAKDIALLLNRGEDPGWEALKPKLAALRRLRRMKARRHR